MSVEKDESNISTSWTPGHGRPRLFALGVIAITLVAVTAFWLSRQDETNTEAVEEPQIGVTVAQAITEPSATFIPTVEIPTTLETLEAPSTAAATATEFVLEIVPTAIPSETPTSTPLPADVLTYTVKAGDVLSVVARTHGTTASAIASASGIGPESVLRIGQVLTIPLTTASTPELVASPATLITPTQTTVPAITAEPVLITYTVGAGDVLSVIARQHGTTAAAIAQASGIREESILRLGQVLTIPVVATTMPTGVEPSSTQILAATITPTLTGSVDDGDYTDHEVKAGDTVLTIASKYGVTSRAIIEANQIENPEYLRIGQRLRIPLGTPTPTATSTPYPTPTATPGPPLPAPQLMNPLDGETSGNNNASILLNWSSVGLLSQQEWYLVRLWRGYWPDGELVAREWTKATSWRVPTDAWKQADMSPLPFYWTVIVASRQRGPQESNITWVWKPLSAESEVRSFFLHQ